MSNPQKTTVTVLFRGKTSTFTVEPAYETILQAAQDADVVLPYSCMGGACSSCRAKLVVGSVDMDCNLVLGDDEVAQGYVLSCQARPTADIVRLDFDIE